jgi:hypothetical protein
VADLLARAGFERPLKGIVHAAGLDATVSIADLSASDIAAVLAAKAEGAQLLHDQTRHMALDLFVAYSSLAAVLGSQRRAHYAAANAFLDGLAEMRRADGLVATSINWGPWSGGGMASAEHLAQFERIGNRGLDPDAALAMLDGALASATPTAIVADIDWDVFRPTYESRRPRPVLAAIQAAPSTAPAPSGLAPWFAQLAAVPTADREQALIGLVRREIADTMGFGDAESVPLDRDFYQLGVDSLMMASSSAGFAGRWDSPAATSCSIGRTFERCRPAFWNGCQPTLQGCRLSRRCRWRLPPARRWSGRFASSATRRSAEPRCWISSSRRSPIGTAISCCRGSTGCSSTPRDGSASGRTCGWPRRPAASWDRWGPSPFASRPATRCGPRRGWSIRWCATNSATWHSAPG